MRKVKIFDIRDKCSDLVLALQQQQEPFGFLPISNLRFKDRIGDTTPKEIITQHNFDPVKLHQRVFNSGQYNFLGTRIQLPSSINFKKFDELAQGYWDWHLPLLLRYGFPLDFPNDKRKELCSSDSNHTSAIDFPQDIEHYIKTEVRLKAMAGPYDHPPYGDTSHISPFMSRPKPDSTNRCVIIDLSWPKEASVNHFTNNNMYLGSVYKLTYPTVDSITKY